MTSTPGKWLGLFGLIPFVGLALVVSTDLNGWGALGDDALRGYAALILSFLGGITWGVALRQEGAGMYRLSMLPFFGAWAALLTSGGFSYALLMAMFSVAYLIDHLAAARGLLPVGFLRLRRLLTVVVLLCLLIAALSA